MREKEKKKLRQKSQVKHEQHIWGLREEHVKQKFEVKEEEKASSFLVLFLFYQTTTTHECG